MEQVVQDMTEKESSGGLRKDVDAVVAEMHKRLQEMVAGAGKAGQQIMPVIRGAEMLVDLREIEDEVVVVADLPGVKSKDITVRLITPGTLRITARREEAMEETREDYIIRERRFGEMARTVNLPADVSDEGATATFRNGVLVVRLPKLPEEQGMEITVSEESEQTGEGAAARHRETVEKEYRDAREKMESSGYLSSEEVEREAAKVELEEKGSPEEVSTAAKLRRQKEEEYEEAKRKLSEE
jgi:HSP20 family protein